MLDFLVPFYNDGGEGQGEGNPTEPNPPAEPVDPPKADDKKYTQEEINDIITKRLERERKKYADYDNLKTKLTEFEKAEQERKQSEMTELEKLQAQLGEKETAEQALAEQLEKLQSSVKRQQVVNAFIKAAPSVNIPSERIDAALKLADLSAVNVGEDGVEGVEDVLKALVEQYSFLVDAKKPQKPIGEGSNGSKQGTEKTSEQLLKEAAEKARTSGKPEDKMAYAKLKRELKR